MPQIQIILRTCQARMKAVELILLVMLHLSHLVKIG